MITATIESIVLDQADCSDNKRNIAITWYALANPSYKYVYIAGCDSLEQHLSNFIASPVASTFDFGDL